MPHVNITYRLQKHRKQILKKTLKLYRNCLETLQLKIMRNQFKVKAKAQYCYL